MPSFDPHANFAYSTVATAPSPAASGTSLTLATGGGALMPTAPFNATVWPAGAQPLSSNAEIVRVTGVAGDVLTIVRAQEGSSARSILVGDQFSATITKKTLTDIETVVPAVGSISAGAASASLGQVVFSNSNGVTFGLNGQTVTATVATNYLTTAMASNRGSDFVQATAAFAGTNASGTIASSGISISVAAPGGGGLTNIKVSGGTLSALRSDLTFGDSNGVSFGLNTNGVITATVATNYQSQGAYLTTAMASNRGTDFVQATAAFAGTNASGTINSTGISVSVNATVEQSNQTVGLYASSNTYLTSSGTVDARSLTFRGDKSITVGVSAGEVMFSVGAYLTTAALSGDTSKYVQAWELTGNTAGTTSSAQGTKIYFEGGQGITVSGNSNTIKLSVGSYITTAMASNRGSDFVAATAAFAGTSASGTINSTGISVSIGPYITTAMLSNAATISNIKVSAGTLSALRSDITFVNSQGISFGLETNGQITATVATASVMNISAGTTSQTFGSVVFSNSHGYSFGLNGSTVTVNGPYFSYFRPIDFNNTLTFSFAQSTSYCAPFELPANYSFDRMRIVVSGSVAASQTQATTGNTSLSMSAITSHNIVIYSRGVGANSLSLQYVTSTQHVDQCLMTASVAAGNSSQHSISLRFTFGSNSFTKDYSSSVTRQDWHTSHLTDLTGVKYLDIPLGISLSPGMYWIGYGRSTTFATQAASVSVATRMAVSHNSMFAVSQNTLAMGMLGGATNSSVGWMPGHGSFTTSGAAGTTSSVGLAVISTTGSNNVLYAQFMRIT
jgi:hypothetical protein